MSRVMKSADDERTFGPRPGQGRGGEGITEVVGPKLHQEKKQ
jgi:hypothetical protein